MVWLRLIFSNRIYKDIFFALSFGLLAALLGLVKIDTPGFEGSYSDLREIALLNSLFHIRNPVFIVPLCIVSLLGIPTDARLIAVFLSHVLPLVITWFIYHDVKKRLSSNQVTLAWFFITIVYYTFLLYPILIIAYRWVGINDHLDFYESFQSLSSSGALEMIATAFVSSVYLAQLNFRRSLEETNRTLEKTVNERTLELSRANAELKLMNENQEEVIKERTREVELQLQQIVTYAHMNSHEVRGPLARILGLLQLLEKEKEEKARVDLIGKINQCAIELDGIVRKMNRLLEK